MTLAAGIAAALTFVWLGMVLAISFIEAPLKFRAPGVTLQIGLGIGRLVFRALNGAEVVLAVSIMIALLLTGASGLELIAVTIAVIALAAQLMGVRPQLAKRSDAVLAAGPEAPQLPRSRAHYVYVALELVKVGSLVVAGTVLLAG
ncbi:hypothetical protein C6A86_015110 [Mycobacterium sp. ITM-2016-00316]|uniref:hypothetical protein n=1 Tax=Mycobacterium sp. ITM-2016-00316 TaxID=2099695 RepID=UPI000CF9334F|nr:hypothetical protein [Mycobacterium sp. ITM-2016-00316]WNG79634.1 hypothetical protein C6A86_015110 [Mycobacterium sp. ITM-2016-00316]